MTNKQVIQKFIHKTNASSANGSLRSINNTLYSYNLKIAAHFKGKYMVYPANSNHGMFYSATTSNHVSLLLSELPKDQIIFTKEQKVFLDIGD